MRDIKVAQLNFENDLLDVFKKYGYKTEGIQKMEIILDINETPKVNFEYIQLNNYK